MKKKKGKKIILLAAIGVVVVAAVVILAIVLSGGHRVIKVESFEGDVSLERDSDEKDMVEGMNLKSEDTITTGEDGLVELLVDSDKHILARENTCFEIVSSGNEKAGKLKIKLEYGTSLIEIENKLNDDSTVEVKTPNASLSVRGTTFEVSYSEEDDVTTVEVTDGVVEVKCGDEKKKVSEGECAVVAQESIVVEEIEDADDDADDDDADGDDAGGAEPDDTDDGDDVVASTELPEGALDYSDDVAFEVGDLEGNFGYGVFVKSLAEWEHETTPINGLTVNELVREDVRIRYWIETAEEINDNFDYLAEEDYLMSLDYLKNDNGDTIITAIDGAVNEDGSLFVSYRYCKPLGDDLYVTLNVFSLEDTKIVGSMDIQEFLPLTNDCYYIIGEPEEVKPVGEVVLPETPIFPLEDVEADRLISAEEVPALFKGEVTFEELEYVTKIGDYTRMKQNHRPIQNALAIMCYEPEVEGVYSPIEGTEHSYDANHLNRIFSVMTSDWILDEFLPEGATCPWPENILTLVPATGPQEDKIFTRIIRIYYGEENEIRVDFNFRQNYNAEGTSYREGTTCMFFALDEETGKYRWSYLMEYDSREVNVE